MALIRPATEDIASITKGFKDKLPEREIEYLKKVSADPSQPFEEEVFSDFDDLFDRLSPEDRQVLRVMFACISSKVAKTAFDMAVLEA